MEKGKKNCDEMRGKQKKRTKREERIQAAEEEEKRVEMRK